MWNKNLDHFACSVCVSVFLCGDKAPHTGRDLWLCFRFEGGLLFFLLSSPWRLKGALSCSRRSHPFGAKSKLIAHQSLCLRGFSLKEVFAGAAAVVVLPIALELSTFRLGRSNFDFLPFFWNYKQKESLFLASVLGAACKIGNTGESALICIEITITYEFIFSSPIKWTNQKGGVNKQCANSVRFKLIKIVQKSTKKKKLFSRTTTTTPYYKKLRKQNDLYDEHKNIITSFNGKPINRGNPCTRWR